MPFGDHVRDDVAVGNDTYGPLALDDRERPFSSCIIRLSASTTLVPGSIVTTADTIRSLT